jgi:molecular chaperone IbpA
MNLDPAMKRRINQADIASKGGYRAMRRYNLTPFQPSLLFDRVFADIARPADIAGNLAEPNYDIVSIDDDHTELIVAVPGYQESEVDISEENGRLVISAAAIPVDESHKVLRRGIPRTGFRLEFRLPKHVTAKSGRLVDGLLHVVLERVMPEHLRPRRIAINSDSIDKAAA